MKRIALLMLAMLVGSLSQAADAVKIGEYEVKVEVHRHVASGIEIGTFKAGADNSITAVAVWTAGPSNGVRYDYYDAQGIRLNGGRIDSDEFVKGEKCRLTFPNKHPDKARTMKITRDYGN